MDTTPKRRRHSFGFWAAVALVLGGVLYPLSCGPLYWLAAHGIVPEAVYWQWTKPAGQVMPFFPDVIAEAWTSYIGLWDDVSGWESPPAPDPF